MPLHVGNLQLLSFNTHLIISLCVQLRICRNSNNGSDQFLSENRSFNNVSAPDLSCLNILSRLRLSLGGKGKAVPLQAWSGPEGSRKLRVPDFMTTAQDDGKVVSLIHRSPLPTGNTPGSHFF